jgi:uncharacterized protein YuzE
MNKPKQKIFYDPKSDSLAIIIAQSKEEGFEEISPGISVELNKKGEVIGFEILNASKVLKGVVDFLYHKAKALA